MSEPELAALCKKCLAFEPADRPTDRPTEAGTVAAVAGLRATADERAQRAELEKVGVEGEKAAAEARALDRWNRRTHPDTPHAALFGTLRADKKESGLRRVALKDWRPEE